MTLGRPIEFDRDEALKSAMYVFWSKGFVNTSLTDLLEVMQLSKSSFYQAFSSKRDLFIYCLEFYVDDVVEGLASKLKPSSFELSKLKKILTDLVIDKYSKNKSNGCLLINSANEFGSQDSEISSVILNSFNRIEKVFYHALVYAQKNGEIAKHKNIKNLSQYLLCGISGLQTMSHAGVNLKKIKNQIEIIMQGLN